MAQERLFQAELLTRKAWANFLPRLNAGVGYTFNDAGQLVLCEGFSDTADPATQRQECLASLIAALDPAAGPPA